MHILFLTHYFSPEGNAPATRVYEMTRRSAAEVAQFACLQFCPLLTAGSRT